MSSQTFSVHDRCNFVVNYDYPVDLVINFSVSRSQLCQQNLFEEWMKECPRIFNYSFVCFSICLNNIHIFCPKFVGHVRRRKEGFLPKKAMPYQPCDTRIPTLNAKDKMINLWLEPKYAKWPLLSCMMVCDFYTLISGMLPPLLISKTYFKFKMIPMMVSCNIPD
jgi:hypothetical protein